MQVGRGRAGDAAATGRLPRAARMWWVVAAAAAVVLAVVAVGATVLRVRVVPGDGSVEAGFARDMSTHHAQAVEMAELLRNRTDDAELQVLAADIATTQQAQIGRMSGWLDVWGMRAFSAEEPMAWMPDAASGHQMRDDGSVSGMAMPGMATTAELARLRDANGTAAEVLFLDLMIDHHRGGVAMAEAALARTDHDEVRRLATAMVTAQRSEIDAMRALLGARQKRAAGPSRGSSRAPTP